MKLYAIIPVMLLAGCWCAFSQSISGRVLTTQQQPLDGAHIHTGQLHATTAPDGYYEISGLTEGSHRLVISYVGYKSLDTIVNITGHVVLDALLPPETTRLQEVVVNRAASAENAVHEHRLKKEAAERYSNATLADALTEIAGVSALRTGSTIVKPVINGLHSSRVPVITNNIRLEDQQWGIEHAPNIDINAVGKIAVVKGAAALQYGGDAVGGLVIAEPVQVLKDTLFGRSILTLDANGRGGTLTSGLHKGAENGWTWNATGTLKYLGDREAPDYVLANTGNRETNFAGDVRFSRPAYDATLAYTLYATTIGIARTMHSESTADLVRSINSGQPNVTAPFTYDTDVPRQEITHHFIKAGFNRKFSSGAQLSLQYALQLNQRKEYDVRRGALRDVPALDLALLTHSVNADWKKQQGATTYQAGLSALLQDNEADPDTGVRPLIPNYSRTDAGAYATVIHTFSSNLTGEAGLRYDFSAMEADKFYQKTRWDALGYNGRFNHFIVADYGTQWLTKPEFTYHNISVGLGIRKKISGPLELLANAGLAVRNPNPAELFSDGLHHSNATIELGNLGLEQERAYKFSVTGLYNTDTFNIEAMPYLNYIRNFIYLEPSGIEFTIRGSFPVYNYRQANAVLTGADINTEWKVGLGFTHRLNLSWLHATNITDDEPLIDMPPLRAVNTIRYTGSRENFFAELRSEAVFRQGRYPDNNFTADVPVNGELVPVLVDISTPPPGYHLLHFTSGVQFRLAKTNASVNFSVNNIFNTAYRDYLNRQRFYADEPGRNLQLQLKLNY